MVEKISSNLIVGGAGSGLDADSVDGIESSSLVQNNRSITAGAGLTGGGDLSANRTISHADTSSQVSVDNSGGTVIQDISLDEFGHITSLQSVGLTPADVGALGPDDQAADSALLSGLSPDFYRHKSTGSTSDPNITTNPVILTNHANSPGQGVYWHIITTFYNTISSTSNRGQIAVAYNGATPMMYYRHHYGGTWYAWTNRGNSGATVTSSGSNANGYYRIWSDGYKEQWMSIGTVSSSGYGSTDQVVTFPIAFTNAASIVPVSTFKWTYTSSHAPVYHAIKAISTTTMTFESTVPGRYIYVVGY